MMSLASRRVEPDFVVPALYSVCVDNGPATQQLIRWKGGGPDSQPGLSLQGNFCGASPSEGVLQVLLSLADALWHEERKPLLADLLELASQSGSLPEMQGRCYDI